MSDIQTSIRLDKFASINEMFNKIIEKGGDLRPVFKLFIPFYQKEIIGKNWDMKGTLMGARWPGLSKSYAKWKRKQNLATGSGANLILSGRMKQAAMGGAGWIQEIGKDKLTMGMENISDAVKHQEGIGRMPQRAFFYSADGGMPGRAEQFLYQLLKARLTTI